MADRPTSQASSRRNATMVTVVLFMLPALFTSRGAAAQATTNSDADVITFVNGDKLTGKVVKERGGVLIFLSDMTGDAPISLPWSKIKELRTSRKFAVIGKDQKLKVGRPAPQVPVGTVNYSNDEISVGMPGGEIKNIPAKDAAFVVGDSEFEKAIGHEPSLRHGWIGSGTIGASLLEATQTSRTFTGALGLVRLSPGVDWLAPRNKTIFDATASYGSLTQPAVGTTPASSSKTNILHGDIERDWYLSQRFFVLVDASADHNIGSGLKLQDDFGAGAGYSVIQQPVQTLDVKADIHYEQQEFYPAVPGVAGISLDLIGLSAGELYMRKLSHGMVLNESGVVQPAFNHPSAFTAQFIASLVFPAYKNFGFSLGTQDNYINNPPSGYKKNTFLLTAGLSFSFK